MKQLHLKQYVFIESLNNVIKKNIIALKDINIIIDINHNEKQDIQSELAIVNFAKKYKVPYLIKNSYKKAIKYKANGVFIDSKNKNIIKPLSFKKKFLILGSAHNQLEYHSKLKQNCSGIFLSPIFKNKKYKDNKILSVIKFNLISKYWNNKIYALGGINSNTIKMINMTRSSGIGFKSYVNQK